MVTDKAWQTQAVASTVPATRALIDPLTRRELEILELICDGLSNDEVSRVAGIELPTVKYHLFNIYGKLGVKRRTQAVVLSIYLGIVEPTWLLEKARAIDSAVGKRPTGAMCDD